MADQNGDAEFGDISHDFNESAVELSASDLGADETSADVSEDPELEAIRARVKEMEEEAEKLKEMQSEVERTMNLSSSSSTGVLNLSKEDKADADLRSIYIGNVDYSATAEELEAHFHGCGSVNRVTILCDRYTGHPKGFAYVEFADKESVSTATALDDSLFKGRQIKVSAKRTNVPGISSTNRPPRGRGRGRGRGFYGGGGYGGGFSQYSSGPGYTRPYRGRGAWRPRRGYYYSPY